MSTVRIAWGKNTDLIKKYYEQLVLQLLSPAERAQLSAYVIKSSRELSLLARLLLFNEMDHFGIQLPDLKRLTVDPFGKPRLETSDLNFQFSISHTDDVAVVAMSLHQRLGIDIEKLGRQGISDVASAFNPAEQKWIGSDGERLLKLWTRKEAVLKADGRGLQFDPASIDILNSPSTIDGASLCWQDLTLENNYVGGVAYEKIESTVTISQVTVDDLFFDKVMMKLDR